jgi:hypothetical protein
MLKWTILNRYFWIILHFIAFGTGSVGIFCVLVDLFYFKEYLYTQEQIAEFVILMILSFVAKIIIKLIIITEDDFKDDIL